MSDYQPEIAKQKTKTVKLVLDINTPIYKPYSHYKL